MSSVSWIRLPDVKDLPPDPEREDSWIIRPSKEIPPEVPNSVNEDMLKELYIELSEEKQRYIVLNSSYGRPELEIIHNMSHYEQQITLFDKGNEFFKKYNLDYIIKKNPWITSYLELIKSIRPEKLEAYRKSIELCKKYLTMGEWHELVIHHKVTIQSKKYKNRVYIVHEDPHKRVDVLENGEPIIDSCGMIYSRPDGEAYPVGDSFLAKVMALKTDEDYFIGSANNYYTGLGHRFKEYYDKKKKEYKEKKKKNNGDAI